MILRTNHFLDESGELNHSQIPEIVLHVDKSVRFCGVVDRLGYIISRAYRKDVAAGPIMSEDDNERYALLTTMRRRPNLPWREKIGKTHYFLLRNDKLVQATIPLTAEHLVLVYFDSGPADVNYDKIIMKKLLPLLRKYTETVNKMMW